MAHSSGGAALQEAISILFFTVFILFLLLLCQRGQFGSFNFSRLLDGIGLGAGRHEHAREPQGLPPDPDVWSEPSILSPRDQGATDEQNRESGRRTEPSERTDGRRERRRERDRRSKEEEEPERLRQEPRGGDEELKTAIREPEPQARSRETAEPVRERREERRTRRPENVVDPVEPDTRTRTADEGITEPLKRRREVSPDRENELEAQQRERERKAARLEREREIQELSPRTIRQRAKEREAKHQTRVPQPIRTAPLDYRHESLVGTSKHSAPPDRSYIPRDRSSSVSPVDGRKRRLRYQSGRGRDYEDVIDRPDSYTRLDDPPRSAPLELRHHRLQRDGDLSAPPQGSFSSTRREDEEVDIRRDEERARARRQPELRGGDLADDEGEMGHESRRYMRADKSIDSSAPSSSTSVTSPYLSDRLERDQERGRRQPESRARRQGSKLSVDVPAPERVDRSVVVESATEPEVSPVVVVRPQHNRRGQRRRVSFAGVDSGEEGDREDERRPARREPKKKILKKDRDGDGGEGGRPPSPSGDYDNLEDLMRPSGSSSPRKGAKEPRSSRGGRGGEGGGGSQRPATPTGDDDNLEDLMPPADRATSPKRNSRRRKDDSTASGSPKGGKASSTPPPSGKKKKSARLGSGDESSGEGDESRRVRIDINTGQGAPEKKGKKDKKSEGGGDDDGGGGEDDKKKKKKKKQTSESSDEPEDEEEGDGARGKGKKGPKSGSKKGQKGKKDQAVVADDEEEEDDPANPPVKKKKKKPQAQGNADDPGDDDDDPASKDNGKKKKKDTKQGGGKSGNGRGDDDDDDDADDDGQGRQRRRRGNGGNDGSGRKGNQRRGYDNYDDQGDDDYAGGGGGGGGAARRRRGAQGGNYQNPQDPFFSQGGPMYNNQGQPYPDQNGQSQNGQNPGFFNNMFTRAKNGDPQQGKGGAQGGQDIKPGDIATDGTTADATATDGTTGIPGARKGTNQPPQTIKKGDPLKDATDGDAMDQDPRQAASSGGDPLDDDDSDDSDDPFKAALKQATGSGSGKGSASKDGDPSKDNNSEDDGDGDALGHRERPDRLTKEQRDAINDAEGEDSGAEADGGGNNLDELERAQVDEVDRLVRDGSAEEIQRFLDQKDPSTKRADQKDEPRDSNSDEPVGPTQDVPLAGLLDKEVAADVALDKDNDKVAEPVASQGISSSPRSKDTDALNDASTPTAAAPFPSPFLEPSSNGKDLGSRKNVDADFEESALKSAQQSPVDDLPSPETLFSQRLEVEKQAGVAQDVSSPPITKNSQEQSGASYTPTEPATLDSPRKRTPIKDTFDGPTTPLETAPLPSPTVKFSDAASPAQASPSRRGLKSTTDQDIDSDAHNSPKYAADQLHDKSGATKATQDTADSPDSPNYAADQLFYKTEEDQVNKDASPATPTKQKAAQADSSPLGLGQNGFPLDKSMEKDSMKDTDSILDAYTEQEPIRVTNVTTGNPTLVEDKDLHQPQQAEFMSVDARRSSVDSGYGTRVPSPISPAKMEQSKKANTSDNLPSPSPPADVSPISPPIQAKTQQPQSSEQVLDSPVSPASLVQASPVQQKGQAASSPQGLPQVVPELQREDLEDRQADDAGFKQTATKRPEDKDSSDSDEEGAPTIANQPQKAEAPRNNKQTMGTESEEETDDKARTKEKVDPSIEAEKKPAVQDEQKADSKTQAPDGTTLLPREQTAQRSGTRGSASEASEAEIEETDSDDDFEDKELLDKAQKGKNSKAGLLVQNALHSAGNLSESQIKSVKGAQKMLRLKDKQLEDPFILARAFKMGDPAPGPPSNWERVWRGDKKIPSNMKTGGQNVPQGQTAPTQQQGAMAHNGHGEGEMRHKDKDRHKPQEQSGTELSDGDDEGSGGSMKASKMAGKQDQDLESQLPNTQAGGSFLHPWRLTQYTFSTIKHAPVWSAATLVCTIGYVGGAYFWYMVLNSSQASTATTLAKRAADSSTITSAASSVAKMGINTQLAFSILNIYCFLGLLLLALMAHTTMEHAENPGQSKMEWLKHPFQTMSKGGQVLAASVSGVFMTFFMQAGLNGPMTFWHKMSWWTAMRLGLCVLQFILLGLSNNQVISLTYMTITQEPNPPFSTWDVQYTASTLGLAAKSLDAQTLLALASAWLFFFVLIATWSWYSLLHPSAKHKGKHKWSLSKAIKCGCAPGWIVETIGVVVLIVVFGCFIAFFTEVMAVASKQVGGSSGQTSFMLANGVFVVFAVLMTWVGFELDKFARWFWPKLSGTWCK